MLSDYYYNYVKVVILNAVAVFNFNSCNSNCKLNQDSNCATWDFTIVELTVALTYYLYTKTEPAYNITIYIDNQRSHLLMYVFFR